MRINARNHRVFAAKAVTVICFIALTTVAAAAAFGPQSLSLQSWLTPFVGAAAPEANAFNAAEPIEPSAMLTDSGTLASARSGHTATLLADGRVLVVGGSGDTSAEIFDPARSTAVATGNTNVARTGHTATRLADGRVLIAGGSGNASTEIYDPADGTFSEGPNMTTSRTGHTATALAGGSVLITGGGSDTAELFDGSGFTAAGTMTASRTNHSAAKMNDGRVFIAGGDGSDTAEIYNPADGTFTAAGNAMTLARAKSLLRVLPDGKIQIIGGNGDGSMEVYDPAIDTIGAYAHVVPESDPCANLINYVLKAETRAALIYSGASGANRDRSGHTITEIGNGEALVIGGTASGGGSLNSVTVFQSSDATVTTDKLDYAPGETVTVSGTGFAPGETVVVKIHEDPHTEYERGLDGGNPVADASGNFTGTYLVQDYDLDMKFIVGARGSDSGRTSQTTFTDAKAVNLTLTGTGSGTVTSTANPSHTNFNCTRTSGVNSGTCGSVNGFDNDAVITFTATPTGGSSVVWAISPSSGPGQFPKIDSGCGANDTSCVIDLDNSAATVTVTFTAKTNQTITFGPLGNKTYGDADFGVSATASSSLAVSFTSSTLSVCTVTGSTVHIVSAGSCTVRASQAGDSNYNAAPDVDQSFTVQKANATVVVTPYDVTYDGNAHTATVASITGVNGETGATVGTVDVSNTTHTDAGNYATDYWFFTGTANYNDIGNTTITDNISQAVADCSSITGYSGTYDANAHGASGSCTGVDAGGAALGGSLDLGASFTDAPGGTANWSFTGGTNYTDQNGSVAIVINKADATCDIQGYGPTAYDGASHGATGTCRGVLEESLAGLDLGAQFTNAPGGTANWTFTDATGNYNDDSGTAEIVITQVLVTVTASSPADISYGSATPTVTASYSGFVVPENESVLTTAPTCGTSYVPGNPVGPYTTSCSGAAATNYTFSYVSGSFNVTAVTLNVNAVANSKVYGDSDPTFTFTLSGFVLGEDATSAGVSGSAACTRTAGETVLGSPYTVTCAPGTLAAVNYVFTTGATANFNITPKALVASVTANDKVFDGNNTATLTGCTFTNLVGSDVVNCSIVGASATFSSSLVGSWPVTATGLTYSGPAASNYSFNGMGNGTASILAWTLNGFYQPVGIPNTYNTLVPTTWVWNTIKGGQTVPLKFNIFAGGVELTNTSAVAFFTAQDFPCNLAPSASEDIIEVTTTGGTSLRYSGTPGVDGQFIQNWQTPKAPDKCYRVMMRAQDGSMLVSFFKTKK